MNISVKMKMNNVKHVLGYEPPPMAIHSLCFNDLEGVWKNNISNFIVKDGEKNEIC